MVYSPRLAFLPDRSPPEQPTGCFAWLQPVLSVGDSEMLRMVGLDSYVFLRFLRLNLIVSFISLIWSFLILVPIYGTSSKDMEGNTFASISMDALRPGSKRLWASFVSSYLLTILVLVLVKKEWELFIAKKREFFENADKNIPGGNQMNFTVRVENLPMHIRGDSAFRSYLHNLFPDQKNMQDSVHLNQMGDLSKAIDKCEITCINLETAIALQNKQREQKYQARLKESDTFDDNDCANTQPTAVLRWLCLPGRSELVNEDDEVVETGSCCCSTTVNAIPYYRRLLADHNKEATELKEKLLGERQIIEDAFEKESSRAGKLSSDWVVDGKINDNGMKSSTAHATFGSRQAALDASQILLSNEQAGAEICPASDPRDIIWPNVTMNLRDYRRRHFVVSLVVKLFALFLFIPLLIFCNVFGDIERLSKLPGLTVLENLEPGSFAYEFVTTQVPPLLQSVIVGALPAIFAWIAIHIEKMKLFSSVQRSVLDRGFGYQLVNIYFTLLGNALASTMKIMIDDPKCIFEILGRAIPQQAGYFTQIILVNALMGLTLNFSRLVALITINFFQWSETKNGVSTRKKDKFFEPIQEDGGIVSYSSGCLFPGFLLVTILGFTYAVMVPFMNCCTTLFFALALAFFRFLCLFVYIPCSESGGSLFPTLYNYVLTGLNFANATMMGYMILKEGWIQFVLLIILFPIVEGFRSYVKTNYVHRSERLCRERGLAIDRQMTQNAEEKDDDSEAMHHSQDSETQAHSSGLKFDDRIYRQPELNFEPLYPLNKLGHDEEASTMRGHSETASPVISSSSTQSS